MDKNTITGFVLIALVLIGFTYFSQPSAEQIAEARRQDSIAAVNAEKQRVLQQQQAAKQVSSDSSALMAAADTTSLFGMHKRGQNNTVTLQNELLKIELNTLGGVITDAHLKDYKDQKKKPVQLFSKATSYLHYILPLKEENLKTAEMYFNAEKQTDSTVTMTLNGNDGSTFAIEYKLIPHTYMVNGYTYQRAGTSRNAQCKNHFH